MKPDYKNWVPKGMVAGVTAGAAVVAIALIIVACTGLFAGVAKLVISIVLAVALVILLVYTFYCFAWYNAFSYNGRRQMSREIIEGVAGYVDLPDGGTGLDIGCGSGALTIAVAKRNPHAKMVGLDRWGKEYASFNKPLCENNAKLEGVSANTEFVRGDATALQYPDETFDAITSNYCMHNIPSTDRQKILLEDLRVLKKGGTFAIHDIFSRQKYGDMEAFVKKLKDMGYERVELVDTTKGLFMSEKEAKFLALGGSALLTGKK